MTSKIFKRKCSSCGNIWLIDSKEQNASDSSLRSAALIELGSLGSFTSQNTRSTNTISTQNAEVKVKSLKQCPQCSSSLYNEEIIYADPTDQSEMFKISEKKKCPDCAEIIKLEANKCKHCGHQFETSTTWNNRPSISEQTSRKKEYEQNSRKEATGGCLKTVLVLAGIFFLFYACVGGL